MKRAISTLAVTWVFFSTVIHSVAAENHRLLILDTGNDQSSAGFQLMLVEVESGKILGQAKIGDGPEFGISPRANLIAVLCNCKVAGISQGTCRLDFYRTSDLTQIGSEMLPVVGRTVFQRHPPYETLAFSANANEIISQRMNSYLSEPLPDRQTMDEVQLTTVTRPLPGDDILKPSRKTAKIPRCRVARFLRVLDWPRIHLWNNLLGAVEVVDLEKGKILSRLALGDDPVLQSTGPIELESPYISDLYERLSIRGEVVCGEGRYAYYLPTGPANPHHPGFAGLIRKIDLSNDPPRVVAEDKELQNDLRAEVGAASDAAGALFVLKDKLHANGFTHLPSGTVKAFSTLDLKFMREIKLPFQDCKTLQTSQDGKYLYALSNSPAQVAVINIGTGRTEKVLDRIGKFPVLIFSVTEAKVASGKAAP